MLNNMGPLVHTYAVQNGRRRNYDDTERKLYFQQVYCTDHQIIWLAVDSIATNSVDID
jgi:hypothetical protein